MIGKMGTRNKMLILNVDENGSFSCNDETNDDKRFIACETTLEEGDTDLNDYLTKRIKLEVEDSDCENDISDQFVDNGFMPSVVSNQIPGILGGTTTPSSQDDSLVFYDGLIMLHMDIREPLTSLRYLLEEKLRTTLTDFCFTLQDSQELESHKNLVDQCVQGEGLVQVNVEIKNDSSGKRINIVDVLKPAEEYVEIGQRNGEEDEQDDENGTDSKGDEEVMRWVVDANFKKDQIKLNIPDDPMEWDVAHVRHWLLWAVRQFNLTRIQLSDWAMTGAELNKITPANFKAKIPHDPDSLFWTHFELLRKCKIVAVKPNHQCGSVTIKQEVEEEEPSPKKEVLVKCKNEKVVRMSKTPKIFYVDSSQSSGVFNSYNNGQIQLWQFLLELLTDKAHRNVIQWLETEGEFKLINPEHVAYLWGQRKNKPHMNYEKLSRALRYYYDGDMISKVHGKRFVYKFVCDLKQLMGYSASELNALVIEAELKTKQNSCLNPIHNIFPTDYISMLS